MDVYGGLDILVDSFFNPAQLLTKKKKKKILCLWKFIRFRLFAVIQVLGDQSIEKKKKLIKLPNLPLTVLSAASSPSMEQCDSHPNGRVLAFVAVPIVDY